MQKIIFVIIPSWNAAKGLSASVESVLSQAHNNLTLVVVDNGSSDESRTVIQHYLAKDTRVRAIYNDQNYGFTGGVNPGIELALEEHADYVALFNNDAIADRKWLEKLVDFLDSHPKFGIAACKLLHSDGKTIDSTGDQYSVWGLPYPRGRNEPTSDAYDGQTSIFGASGGASMYRVSMLRQIGTFDQDFFAYYEDIDISFRAQLAGWKVGYVPESIVYHEQGKTSSQLKGFTVYHSFKNFPMVIVKDVPKGLLHVIVPRFLVSYGAFLGSAVLRGKGWYALRGIGAFLWLLPRKLRARHVIQRGKKVDAGYISSLLLHDIPPDQTKLMKLRSFWWKLKGKNA
jgi:GT2 family glycosyltransferase